MAKPIRQHVIHEAPVSLRSQRIWYGDRAVDNMLKITELIKPYVRENYPGLRPYYQTYFVTQYDSETDSGTDRRILSNLFPDCPTFYPIKKAETNNVNADGFADIDLSDELHFRIREAIKRPGLAIAPADNIVFQDVISKRTVSDDYLVGRFGSAAIDAMNAANKLLYENGIPFDFVGEYEPYLVRQFFNDGTNKFEGLVLTCLIRDTPCIYPLFQKDFPVNRTNGYRTIILPNDLVEKIRSLDYRGCCTSPTY